MISRFAAVNTNLQNVVRKITRKFRDVSSRNIRAGERHAMAVAAFEHRRQYSWHAANLHASVCVPAALSADGGGCGTGVKPEYVWRSHQVAVFLFSVCFNLLVPCTCTVHSVDCVINRL